MVTSGLATRRGARTCFTLPVILGGTERASSSTFVRHIWRDELANVLEVDIEAVVPFDFVSDDDSDPDHKKHLTGDERETFAVWLLSPAMHWVRLPRSFTPRTNTGGWR